MRADGPSDLSLNGLCFGIGYICKYVQSFSQSNFTILRESSYFPYIHAISSSPLGLHLYWKIKGLHRTLLIPPMQASCPLSSALKASSCWGTSWEDYYPRAPARHFHCRSGSLVPQLSWTRMLAPEPARGMEEPPTEMVRKNLVRPRRSK